ncbi:hypothetical protein A5881_000490 [Enterococcus termitis]
MGSTVQLYAMKILLGGGGLNRVCFFMYNLICEEEEYEY